MRRSARIRSGQASRWSKNGSRRRIAFGVASHSRRFASFCCSAGSAAEAGFGAQTLTNASPGGRSGVFVQSGPTFRFRAGAPVPIGRSSAALRAPRAPGRPAAPTGARPHALLLRRRDEPVADVALPLQPHVGGERHLAEHDPVVEVRVVLLHQHRVAVPLVEVPADRVRHVAAGGGAAALPPRVDGLGHARTLGAPSVTPRGCAPAGGAVRSPGREDARRSRTRRRVRAAARTPRARERRRAARSANRRRAMIPACPSASRSRARSRPHS